MIEKLSLIEDRYREIEMLLSNPEIAGDYNKSQNLIKEHASLKNVANLTFEYRTLTESIDETKSLIREENDRDITELAREELDNLELQKTTLENNLRIALLPKDPNDSKNVIMEIRAGTGGDEAGLFAADLYRMYNRYAQRNSWQIDIINNNESGLGSIKEIVFKIDGDGAYSKLKHEIGVHRVQRVPLTESSGRVHTSAATVAVLPEAEEVDVEIVTEDIQIDVFHSSGHGGQNVQKVATAIRITHKPTGLVAVCQDERSQLKNKQKAMAVLRSRLLAMEIERQEKEITDERRSQVGSGDRSAKVRTYNFPQNRVTDHRISLTTHNLDLVLDGDLNEFIESLILEEQAFQLNQANL
mgnify:FL=1|tara:strand:- start:1056 stop:2126 length:1071 start_codon:yes stop_codon:yes gene_type:complete